MEKDVSCKQQSKARVTVLISDKVDLKSMNKICY